LLDTIVVYAWLTTAEVFLWSISSPCYSSASLLPVI